MRRSTARDPSRGRLRGGEPAVCILLGACFLAALAAAPAQAFLPPPEDGASTASYHTGQVKRLLDYGEMMAQCQMEPYASVLFQHAQEYAVLLNDPALHARVMAASIIHAIKQNEPGIPDSVLVSVAGELADVTDPDTRCLVHLALGYNAMNRGQKGAFRTALNQAREEAQRTGNIRRQGDYELLDAFWRLAGEDLFDAATTAKAARLSYARAGQPLCEVEAYRLIARIYGSLKNASAARAARQNADSRIADVSQGPILDLRAAARMAVSPLGDHRESARLCQFQKASHQVLTLLLLNRNRLKLPGDVFLPESLRLNEAELLAYLACYVLQQADALAGRSFLRMSETAISNDPSAAAKGRHRMICVSFWRMAGRPDTAMEEWKRAEGLWANVPSPPAEVRAELAEEQGLILLAQGDREGAIQSLERARKMVEGSAGGGAEARLARYVQGIRNGASDVPALVSNVPDSPEAKRQERRQSLAAQGDPLFRSPFVADYGKDAEPSAAQAVLKTSLTRPSLTRSPLGSPETFIRTKRWDKAIPQLEAILRAEGDSVKRLMQLGECYYNTREWTKAADAFGRALKIDPNHAGAKGYLEGIRRIEDSKGAAKDGGS